MPVRLPLALAAAVLAGMSLASLARAEGEIQPEGGPGIWQPHEVELDYMGFTTTYSCDGLQSKLELLLRQLGARADAKVSAFGCSRGYGTPSKFARATLKFAALQPLDPASSASAPDAASPPVAGVWRQLELAPYRPFGLQDGDCELMEQFRDKVLPLFVTRAQQIRTQCVPHQDTGGPFSLNMQVFAPVPAAKSK
jgi:hypothetical protein